MDSYIRYNGDSDEGDVCRDINTDSIFGIHTETTIFMYLIDISIREHNLLMGPPVPWKRLIDDILTPKKGDIRLHRKIVNNVPIEHLFSIACGPIRDHEITTSIFMDSKVATIRKRHNYGFDCIGDSVVIPCILGRVREWTGFSVIHAARFLYRLCNGGNLDGISCFLNPGDLILMAAWSEPLYDGRVCNLRTSFSDEYIRKRSDIRYFANQCVCPSDGDPLISQHPIAVLLRNTDFSQKQVDVVRNIINVLPRESIYWGNTKNNKDSLFYWFNRKRIRYHPEWGFTIPVELFENRHSSGESLLLALSDFSTWEALVKPVFDELSDDCIRRLDGLERTFFHIVALKWTIGQMKQILHRLPWDMYQAKDCYGDTVMDNMLLSYGDSTRGNIYNPLYTDEQDYRREVSSLFSGRVKASITM